MQTVIAATEPESERQRTIDLAVELLQRGEIVALPTETVYGLAADATRPEAVAKIFEAKERPLFDPLIVHLPERDWLGRIVRQDDVFVLVEDLTQAFWPGPLTLVLPRWSVVPDIVTAGLDTVAVRMSAHPVFREIARTFARPIAAPSANRFGRISPTAAAHVMTELGGRIPLIVDGGATIHGIESTIVRVEAEKLTILRAGPITREELEAFAPVEFARTGPTVTAPGQLKSHYAPRTPLIIAAPGMPLPQVPRIGHLTFRESPHAGSAASETLSRSGDLREAATTLFAKLRRLDESGLDLIVAEPLPEIGLGVAIMDRLRKAAADHIGKFPSP